MTIDCPLPHPSALLDNNGYMGSTWWACIKAVHERTGGAQGVSSKDMETAINWFGLGEPTAETGEVVPGDPEPVDVNAGEIAGGKR